METRTNEEVTVKKNFDMKKTIMWIATILLPLFIYLIPVTEAFTPQIRTYFALTLFAILIWAFELLPFIIPSLVLPIFYLLFELAPGNMVFVAWSSYIPWMVLAGMIIMLITKILIML